MMHVEGLFTIYFNGIEHHYSVYEMVIEQLLFVCPGKAWEFFPVLSDFITFV